MHLQERIGGELLLLLQGHEGDVSRRPSLICEGALHCSEPRISLRSLIKNT